METKRKIEPHIRWLIRCDMPHVLDIEGELDEPWTEKDFLRVLRNRNCIGMVVENGDDRIGYMIYELHKRRLEYLNFVVGKKWRRQGVGTRMIEKLKAKLSKHRRHKIIWTVPETETGIHLFLKAQGFEVESIERGGIDEPDWYKFVYRLEAKKPKWRGKKRIQEGKDDASSIDATRETDLD